MAAIVDEYATIHFVSEDDGWMDTFQVVDGGVEQHSYSLELARRQLEVVAKSLGAKAHGKRLSDASVGSSQKSHHQDSGSDSDEAPSPVLRIADADETQTQPPELEVPVPAPELEAPAPAPVPQRPFVATTTEVCVPRRRAFARTTLPFNHKYPDQPPAGRSATGVASYGDQRELFTGDCVVPTCRGYSESILERSHAPAYFGQRQDGSCVPLLRSAQAIARGNGWKFDEVATVYSRPLSGIYRPNHQPASENAFVFIKVPGVSEPVYIQGKRLQHINDLPAPSLPETPAGFWGESPPQSELTEASQQDPPRW